MQAAVGEDLLRRVEFERARIAPPAGFPHLPDVPIKRYTDEAFFRAEIDQVFRKSWLFAGHESEWEKPGSFKRLDLPFAPVVVTKNRDGELRAFLNVCRHRGSPVVREAEGTAKLFACPYHGWVYNLDGELQRVSHQRDFNGICKEDLSMTNVRCERWGTFVFVNLDSGAPPVDEFMAPMGRRFEDLIAAPWRHVETVSIDIPCNWKLMIEGFIEAYHVDFIHSKTLAPAVDSASSVQTLHANGHSSIHPPMRDTDAGRAALAQVIAPDLPAMAMTSDFYTQIATSFLTFPNVVWPVGPDGFPVLSCVPIDHRTMRLDMHFYGLPWGDGPRPDSWDMKIGAWQVVTQEDYDIVQAQQQGLEAAAHDGIPLSYQERRIYHFNAEIDRMLGDRLAQALRLPDRDLLDSFIEH